MAYYKITKIVRAFWLVKNQWFIFAGKLIENLLNHSSSARDLQHFLVFSQQPALVITPVNP